MGTSNQGPAKKWKSPLLDAKDWTHGESAALLHHVGGDLVGRDVLRGKLRVRVEPSLVSGKFLNADQQRAKWLSWLPMLQSWLEVSLKLTDMYDEPPRFGRDAMVVLALHAPTAWQEFRVYWPLICGQHTSCEMADIRFDDEYLAWVKGSENTDGWRFEWHRINWFEDGDNVGVFSAEEVHRLAIKDKKSLPAVEILAALAIHSDWVNQMDGKKVPFVNFTGYRYRAAFGKKDWNNVPYFSRNESDKVGLYGVSSDHKSNPVTYFSPVFS